MRKGILTAIVVVLFALTAVVSYAAPTGPTDITTVVSSSYVGSTDGVQVDAIAGNVTELNINGSSTTRGWQGFYGNILGTIMLGDSNNLTLYDWTTTSPKGQIYATNTSSVTWSEISCSNSTEIDNVDTALGFAATAADRINETFSFTANHDGFYVGSVQIAANDCAAAELHNSTSEKSADWQEVLLSDNSGEVIYTSLLNPNLAGFNGSAFDFQMIVGENGHGNTASTPYYFWVELE